MLTKISTLGGLLGPRVDHPLADSRELRRILAELPVDNGFKALDEVAGWLESLLAADDFPVDLRFEVVQQLDDAIQPHLRRLGRDYLQAARLSRTEEKRLWTIIRGAWHQLSVSYELCLKAATANGKLAEGFKPSLALLCGRLIAALGAANKWDCFRYARPSQTLWAHLGYACLVAEELGVGIRPVALYPGMAATTVVQEYLKVLVFQASAMDSLLPLEIELAEKLIAHFVPHFVFGPESRPDSVYWVDLARSQPPMRLARAPKAPSPGLRFFQPGSVQDELEQLARDLEAGHDLSRELNLGGQYAARTLLPVIRHLAANLAPVPPQRRHRRHAVKHRMAVVAGRAHALAVFSPDPAAEDQELPMESWVVEDVSLGGFGAVVGAKLPDWLRIGALLALQPEGGDNWLLGIVRRCSRDSEAELRVGIESLARQVAAVQLTSRQSAWSTPARPLGALWLQDGKEAGETRLVLPPHAFDPNDSIEFEHGGRRVLLTPVDLVEQAADYEVGRYRTLIAE